MSSTFKKWSEDVGDNFKFSIKLWKEITHAKELNFNEADIEKFVKNAHFLQEKKGCLLLQFPGKITLEYFNKVEQILELLANSEYTNEWHKAIEFRNVSWQTGETYELLDEFNTSLVLHDFPKGKTERIK